jgi:hypothetical protein
LLLKGNPLNRIKTPDQTCSIGSKIEMMATVEISNTNQTPTEDPHYPAAVERVKAAVRELQAKGIIDGQGKRVRQDLPADMQENADRDFGG